MGTERSVKAVESTQYKQRHFFSNDSEVSAYWAGFLAADGFIHDNKPTISLNLGAKDLDHLIKFASIFGREDHIRRNKINNSYYLNLYNATELIEELKAKYNITYKKTFTLQPPKVKNDSHKKAFIAGYIDGDGCIAYESTGKGSKILRLTILGTNPLLAWIKEYFDSFTEKPTNKLEKHKNIFRYRVSGKQALEVIKSLYSETLPLMERKWSVNLDVPYYIEDKELEYKYKADNIKLTDFSKLLKSFKVKKEITVSSYDTYYTHDQKNDWFIRFRDSDEKPELTKKRKIKDSDNWERVEVDVPLSAEAKEDVITKFVNLDGYSKNFKIYKTCAIYWLEDVNFVYYVVYDEDLREKNRFIEIEINKDKANELGNKAFAVLKKYENLLEPLGITHVNRLKKSLFEMYRRPQ